MRTLAALALASLISVPAFADPGDDAPRPQLSSRQCGLTTDYNVLVDGGGGLGESSLRGLGVRFHPVAQLLDFSA